MKLMMGIACGVAAAAVACASNKPPEDATQANNGTTMEPPSTAYASTPTTTTSPAYNSTPTATTTAGPTEQPSTAGATTPVPPPAAQNTSALATPAPAPADVGGAPDNSRVNKRDRSSAGPPTPMDQGNNASDLKITQEIRKAVVGDGSLSFTAKNVKIITTGGKVTLRGPVKTDQERQTIEASARKVAGANVDNQLEVKN